jgi:hypothetical protein
VSRFPDPTTSRAVLIGFSRYDDERALPKIPAVQANLTDLKAALVGAPTGTLDAQHCTEVSRPAATVGDVGKAITTAALEATDLLLVYYAGHGLVDDLGRLHLALPSTDPARLRWTALPFEVLREEIAASPATTRVLVLDCCFSGRAIEAMTGPDSVIKGQIDIAGTYTLTSTTATALSHAPQGAKYTAFTGAMLAASSTPGPLTLDELFRLVYRRLVAQGAPRPQRRVVNAAGDLALFKGSPTSAQESDSEPPRTRRREDELPMADRTSRRVRLPRRKVLLLSLTGAAAVAGGVTTALVLTSAPPDMARTVLAGHTATVTSVAFSPDSHTVATGSQDGSARLWDTAAGKQIGQPLIGHTATVNDVAFSPDGHALATGSEDETARLWGVLSHQETGQPLSGAKSSITAVAFSPDGHTLATGTAYRGYDESTLLWDVASHQQIGDSLTPDTANTIYCVAFSPDGRTLVTADAGMLIMWNVASHQEIRQDGPGDGATCVVFSPDGGTLVTCGYGAVVSLWDAASFQPVGQSFTASSTGKVNGVAFSPDGRTLATGGDDRTVRLWDVASRQEIAEPLTGHSASITSVAFSPDGHTLVTGSQDRTARLWDMTNHH